MDTTQQKTLRAALDRLIPADDFPGAWESGVGDYIAGQMSGDLRDVASEFFAGLADLDAEARANFGKALAELAPEQQDQLLRQVEKGDVKASWREKPAAFFNRLLNLAMEGYYSDAGNGGNRGETSWKMIGYEPGAQVRHAVRRAGDDDSAARQGLPTRPA